MTVHSEHPISRPAIGDTVKVGQGRKLWTIDSFWTAANGEVVASLRPRDEGYTNTSAALDRLTAVQDGER